VAENPSDSAAGDQDVIDADGGDQAHADSMDAHPELRQPMNLCGNGLGS
jgi:hypothetical protein